MGHKLVLPRSIHVRALFNLLGNYGDFSQNKVKLMPPAIVGGPQMSDREAALS